MRAFDLLAKAEFDIRNASNPRHHFEMAMLKWMHVRKMVPLMDLLGGGISGGGAPRLTPPSGRSAAAPSRAPERAARPAASGSAAPASRRARSRRRPTRPGARLLVVQICRAVRALGVEWAGGGGTRELVRRARCLVGRRAQGRAARRDPGGKSFFYNTVVAQAQAIDVSNGTVTFTFRPRTRRCATSSSTRARGSSPPPERIAGRKVPVVAVQAAALGRGRRAGAGSGAAESAGRRRARS